MTTSRAAGDGSAYARRMSVDPALLKLTKTIEEGQPWPRPRCPSCMEGYIHFSEPVEHESHESIVARDNPYFEPEFTVGTFLVQGQCENAGCKQIVHGVGDYSVAYSQQSHRELLDEGYVAYSDYYDVASCHPPLWMMTIPESAPEEVREGMRRASRVFFADPSLAATALRGTVERFLTSEGISAVRPSGQFRSAHQRIEEWRAADPSRERVADLLLAVKWLGNAGTHEASDLSYEEVLDGARVLDEAFYALFTSASIDAQARAINAAKGPPRQP